MPEKVFRLQPQDSQCREALCLDDYEAAWIQHQRLQFERVRVESSSLGEKWRPMGQDFDKFRSFVWGNSHYADGMRIRVRGVDGQHFSWGDVAADGRIEYADVQGLMDLGLVEFLVPSHRCSSSRINPQWLAFPVRNRRDFQSVVDEMQGLRPLHGEGMGNVFWALCLPEVGVGGAALAESAPAKPLLSGLSEAFRAISTSVTALAEEEPCGGGEVEYFDDDLGQAICEESEISTMNQVLGLGLQNMFSSSISHGVGAAFTAGAWEIGRVAAAEAMD